MTSEHCQLILDDVTISRHLDDESTFLYSLHPASTTLSLMNSTTSNNRHLLVCLDYLNLCVSQSSLRSFTHVQSSPSPCNEWAEWRQNSLATHFTFQVLIKKLQLDLPFPAKKPAKSPWNHQPYRFVLIIYKKKFYAMLSVKRTPMPKLFP